MRECTWDTKGEKSQAVPSPVGSNKRTRRWHAVVQIHCGPLMCTGGVCRVDGHQLNRSPLHLEGVGRAVGRFDNNTANVWCSTFGRRKW